MICQVGIGYPARNFVNTPSMAFSELPPISADQQAHTDQTQAFIREQIRQAGGAIAFSRFMELALYAPGLGYYSAGAAKLGVDGDFITAPELGQVFARCVAQSIAPVIAEIGAQDAVFFELGGGTGAFAVAALRQLQLLDALPSHYWILEPSADLRQRQQQRIAEQLPPSLAQRCVWLDRPPQAPWRGVLFANEVLDALPTTRFVIHDGEVFEEFIVLSHDQQFICVDQPADPMLHQAVRHIERTLGAPLPEGYRSEVLPQLPYWIQAIGGLLQQGAMLYVDYGYPRREYYRAERRDGTLVCHYRHHAHADPLHLPGLQDITAFVDFTALVEAGVHAGFDFAGYCAQASYLLANGLSQQIAAAEDIADQIKRYQRLQEIKRLTIPGEMGERFQVMGFVRDVDLSVAFALADLSRRL